MSGWVTQDPLTNFVDGTKLGWLTNGRASLLLEPGNLEGQMDVNLLRPHPWQNNSMYPCSLGISCSQVHSKVQPWVT